MKVTAPLKDEEVLRRSIRGYFGIADECNDQPSARISHDSTTVTLEANENDLGFEQDIRNLYANICGAFPATAWEAKFPELLP